jgi:hypothetical protein
MIALPAPEDATMKLEGSCHCGAVKFSLASHTPYPFMRCYCTICRKTAGGGGYAINIMGDASSLRVRGAKHVSVYRARIREKAGARATLSPGRRHFCAKCGSALWAFDPRWPEWVYPFASAIDTPLPRPPEQVEMMLEFAAPWAEIPRGSAQTHFPGFPEEGIADWHAKRGLAVA